MSVKKIGINDIIDDIVNQNRIEFNKKSKKQQENQKEQISDTIKLALAGRNNNDERQTILIEISKSVNSHSQSFFDSNGNIDINLLSEVAKSTVKNAEKAGIITPVGNNAEKSNKAKINFTEVALTAVVINKMINNYENLSKEEVNILLNNYSKFSRSQQKELDKQIYKEVDKVLQDNKITAEQKKELENEKKKGLKLDEVRDIADKIVEGTATKEDIENYEKMTNGLDLPSIEEIKNNPQVVERILKNKENSNKKIVDMIQRMRQGIATEADYSEYAKRKKEEGESYLDFKVIDTNEDNNKQDKDEIGNGKEIDEYSNPEDITATMEDMVNQFDFEVYSEEEKEEQKGENSNLVKSQIEQLPNELIKAGFSENEIKEAMTTYTDFFKGLDNDDLEALSEETVEGLTETMKGIFENFEVDENVGKILGLMAGITYHGNIKEVLIDSEKREKFFSELEEVSSIDFETKGAEVTTEVTEQQFTDDELKQVFNEYFKANSVEMDVSAIEMQSEKAEVVETFDKSEDSNGVAGLNQDDVVNSFDENMESVSDEDNATQGSTSSGAKKFSLNEVKAVASGVKMPEIQDSTQLIREELNKDLEKEEEQEVQTV